MAISTNSRNSEANSPMRRSFSANPFHRPIHTNSPSEITRSSSLGMEEKENEFDHHTPKQPTKPRSPAVVNGTNHFMLPTISASSKFNPSPRKKVLSDRNEPCKSPSVSINTPDFTKDIDQKLDNGFETPSDTNHLPKGPPRNSHTPIFPKSSVNNPIMGSSTKTLDADSSSAPPYDPKTNYLSPRPQFLHYRPNPRLELYYQKEQNSGANNLEDMFLSESSDTEVSDSENVSSVEAINGSIEKESEDASSIEAVEHGTITTPISTLIFEETSEEKKVVKSRFFTRAKVVPLLLVLLIACLSMSYTDSPIFDSPVYKNLSSSKFYEESVEVFARNLKLWSVSSSSYVNKLISSFSGGEKLDKSQFSNLTYMVENTFIEMKERSEEIYDQDEVEEPVFKDENELRYILDLQNEIDLEDKSCLEEARALGPEEKTSEVIKEEDHLVYDSKTESSTTVSNFENAYVMDILLSEVQSLEQGNPIVFDSEWEPTESSTAVPSFGNTFELGSFQVEPEYDFKISENMEIKGDDSVISDSENTLKIDVSTSDPIPEYNALNQYEALAISLLAIAILAAPVLIYLKKKNSDTSIYTVHIDRVPTNKTMKMNPSMQDYSPESCPSEMSSFGKSYFYSKRRIGGTTNEAQSQEKNQKRFSKRESLSSSSEFSMDDSPSYGSFTTYERLAGKHGYGDDEVTTPVRRSSRIKKIQITS